MSLSAELMGIYREGFGANGQISFTRKNTFGNSEVLNFSLSGGIENLKQIDDNDFKIGSNIGPRLSLTFPRLFMFSKITNNIRKNAVPQTTLSSYFNYQQRSQFARYLTNFSLTYEWNEGKYKKHELSIPNVSISFIRKDSKILSTLSDLSPQQRFKFEDAISTGVKYSFLFNNQSNKSIKNPTFLTAKGWLIGPTALLAEALNIVARDSETNAITLAGIRYATFLKAQVDLRKFLNFSNDQQIALRSFVGFGIPLDEDGVIPFDQLYFSGGANSVRGWRQRALGPGSYFKPDDNLDRLGEIKLEFSAEYRFPITGILKGAVFTDAGNVWTETTENDINSEDRNFAIKRFYKEIAVSPGLGLRLDFDFFLFRLDLGVPLKQPYSTNVWKLEPQSTQVNFGVGYPF
jgi:outer membrane protein assembly factor BamA